MATIGIEQRSQIFKQEAHGPDHSPEESVHINIIMLIRRRKKNHYLLYENLMLLHLNKLESPSPKNVLC